MSPIRFFFLFGAFTIMATLSVRGGDKHLTDIGHPRLYFTSDELAKLRDLRTKGIYARIWKNLAESADWCLTQKPRSKWIAPISPDPIYLNLYDRFYAMMHDMAAMEHLAFAYAYSGDDRYFDAGRQWTLACCRVWKREADGTPNASKAYAVMRLLKGAAVSYDLLYDGFSEDERKEIRDTLVSIGRKYYQWYLENPKMAGPGQDKHHGSVEASSFGVTALALLGEVPEAEDWLNLMVKKHTDYLLPHALTPTGTQEQSSNYWASTMQYRIFFMDALRRVTGHDLFKKYKKFMDGRIALAAVAGPKQPGHNENNQSVIFGPSYGQLDYWSPVLLYLAREYRRPIYQHLALWDASLGAIQKTRYITSNGEQLLFEMGGYVFAWYDPTVPDEIEEGLPMSLEFPDVNEVYARASYKAGGIVVGIRHGIMIIHAGGRPVLIGSITPTKDTKLTDDGPKAVVECPSAAGAGATVTVELRRPSVLTVVQTLNATTSWWYHGGLARNENTLTWPDGTLLRLTKGSILSANPEGHRDEKIVGMGKLKLIDPMPMSYPLLTAQPEGGKLMIEVRVK